MILPTKHLSADRALLTIGGQVLSLLDKPKTVSVLWEDFKVQPVAGAAVPFDWFILALDLLACTGIVSLDGTRIKKKNS
ncbi:hypothetical protein A0257_06755 [Hymenobacter psoromatis]|uniref:ABC-three component system middle component 6 n=1 Tax=Hymenobacter psoromatis TaxID=1484116 RepID=UPI00078CBA45|nr:ABC-three component system middle component 6 [Hymenobacter psoromatis]AMR26837.1 hypothetical protein A0257_06755 [Hymenobacter psoromatis]